MFVTSDTIDLKRISRFQKFEWREHLLGGVSVYGTAWRGYEADARFLLESAKRCGLLDEIEYAGYVRPGDRSTRPLRAKSFERLARGELAGAKDADGLLFRGHRDAEGAYSRSTLFGGETSGRGARIRGVNGSFPAPDYPYQVFNGSFVFPLADEPIKKGAELLRLSVEILGAEYGYFFVRDDLCAPCQYVHGMGTGLDHGPLNRAESDDIGYWGILVGEGRLWTAKQPLFRDLFQVNLLSERHTSAPIEGLGYLHEWILAQPGRGWLEDVGPGRFLWTLTDAEMVDVRPILNEAGALFSCRERVYRDLLQGAADAQRLFDEQKVNWAPWVSDARLDYPGRFSS